MNTSLTLTGLLTSFAIVACAAAPSPEGQGESEQRVSARGDNAPAAKPDASANDSDEPSGEEKVKGEPTEPGPPDPACLATCESGGLAAKCGDTVGGFCESLCASPSVALVACLVAAPDCAKRRWIACKGAASDAGAR